MLQHLQTQISSQYFSSISPAVIKNWNGNTIFNNRSGVNLYTTGKKTSNPNKIKNIFNDPYPKEPAEW
jgi:hypothetical protein